MKRESNHNKFEELRQEYRFFEFQSYSFQTKNKTFEAEFVFNIGDEFWFKPSIKLTERDFYQFGRLSENELENLVFQIGMVELISYWKAACPPKVIVRCHKLTSDQIKWWKKLYFNGLGEFFYLNGIETNQNSFMDIETEGKPLEIVKTSLDSNKVIVPVGGGKDSVVSLELLKNGNSEIIPMMLNPREASIRTINTAGFELNDCIVVERRIDPELLKLNAKGFLNGHTPFSALLGFVTALAAAISQSKYIALSNESSASESTVPDSNINHQYSKSFEFEQDFVWYLNSFVHPKMRYFSFLRPVNELQIAKLFSRFPQHFDGFRSCNVGSKTDAWCGKCPKCLFTYIVLSPFISNKTLNKIFGKDLLADLTLLPIFDELTGKALVKPFECVGTPEEVSASVNNLIQRMEPAKLSGLLEDFSGSLIDTHTFDKLLSHFETQHYVPGHLLPLLKKEIVDDHFKGFLDFLRHRINENQKVLIIGFGREGQSTFTFLKDYFPDVEIGVADRNESIRDAELLVKINRSLIHIGSNYLQAVDNYSIIIKSPGVKITVVDEGVLEKITSQTDLFLQYYRDQTIGVTGTKGKSTTATLIDHFLEKAGGKHVLLGNIGTPPLNLVKTIEKDTVIVFELSAHQLEYVHASPHIAVLLNIFPEHLDYFQDFASYDFAKKNICRDQKAGDFLIIPETLADKSGNVLAEQLVFGKDLNFEKLLNNIECPLKGSHNSLNIHAATLAVSNEGIPISDALDYLKDFNPLPHRLEYVGNFAGIEFYNDSISTIPESTIAAIETLENVNTLILGGFDRGLNYAGLIGFLTRSGVKNFIFLGKAGEVMYEILQSYKTDKNCFKVKHLRDAFPIIVKNTSVGMICLLSPAAASYDQFHNFEHRGDTFKELAKSLPEK